MDVCDVMSVCVCSECAFGSSEVLVYADESVYFVD